MITITRGLTKKGEYFDSVTLMLASRKLGALPGVLDSAIVMGTHENKAILAASGLMLDLFSGVGDMDLLIAVKATAESQAEHALKEVGSILSSLHKRDSAEQEQRPRSLRAALEHMPLANLALISVAGRYAGGVAMQALQHGLNVMLFSDNVPVEQEIALKRYAIDHGLLVMGPDCGTAILNGVPLAFANVVSRGSIGIVAAAGTGLQEVSCLISNAGAGISQAIGTGGRDVSARVGGLMFLEGLHLLANDDATRVIVLVSKPPDPEVLDKIGQRASTIDKPVVAVFLGAEPDSLRKYGMIPAATLEEAAHIGVTRLRGAEPVVTATRNAWMEVAGREAAQLGRDQKYIRGLFSGGTFCYEAQVLLQGLSERVFSNAPTARSHELTTPLKSQEHSLLDLGADEFTIGRLHPMIDYALRNKRIIEESRDPQTAVLLLDVVLGYGSHPDPPHELSPFIAEAQRIATTGQRRLPIVCSVTGTDNDPQNRSHVVAGLAQSGVIVAKSNAAACMLAREIVAAKRGGGLS